MLDHNADRRNFLRHPINVPLLVSASKKAPQSPQCLNVSQGGLSFLSTEKLNKGLPVRITIPVKDKRFKIKAEVVYSRKDGRTGFFITGVCFADYSSAFQAKLAEEMLEILDFRKKLSAEMGHEISEEEAAQKWIGQFSKYFPKIVRKN